MGDARIVGGTIDLDDPATFLLLAHDANPGFFGCSATLIGARTLLTAAHCVSCGIIAIEATNQPHPFDNRSGRLAADLVTVKAREWRIDPGFSINCSTGKLSGHDLALIQLAAAPLAPTRPWNRDAIDALVGNPLRLVGYGDAALDGAGFGRKRSGSDAIASVSASDLTTAGVPSSTCFADSGSAYLTHFPDGTERAIGVVSVGLVDCSGSSSGSRLDVESAFLASTLDAFESASCQSDGLCQPGCVPDDPDCLCVADGQCASACPDKALDPDCPESCAANDVCATVVCPTPDPDCRQPGATCLAADQCPGRRCLADAQHPVGYCSAPCSAAPDCPTPMVCDGSVCRLPSLPVVPLGGACMAGTELCTGATICVGSSTQPSTCRAQCDVPGDCASGVCAPGDAGTDFCGDPVVAAPDAGTPGSDGGTSGHRSPAGGCSAAGGADPLALGMATVLACLGLRACRAWPRRAGSRRSGGARRPPASGCPGC